MTGLAWSESIQEIHLPRHTSHKAISPAKSADTNSADAPEIESNGTHKSWKVLKILINYWYCILHNIDII